MGVRAMARIWDQAQEIIETLRASRSEADILSGLGRGGDAFGYENFFMTGLPERPGEHLGSYAMLSGWPEAWLERYIDKGYVHVDPVIRRVRSDNDPFMWDDAPYDRDDAAAARVMDESPDYGLVKGMTVPIHGIHGFHAAVCFSAGHEVRWSGARLGALQLIAIFAHSQASAIIEERGGGRRPAPRLSPREIEVLKWSTAGKSTWDISVILGLSQDTVGEYLANAQRKLDAANRTHAVAEAMRHRLIL
jgi:LuxR family transcriptional regulator, quorum-sensing system regulator BjaR1